MNNAGATWGANAEDHPIEAWDKVMDLNVRAPFVLSQRIGAKFMIPRGYGRILNLASIAGMKANALEGTKTIAYNTSKAAVINFTRALAAEWAKHGINVNALAPGFFPSKMTAGTLSGDGLERLTRRIPQGRIRQGRRAQGSHTPHGVPRRRPHHGADSGRRRRCHRALTRAGTGIRAPSLVA